MDEIIFQNRNKAYGAFLLRNIYGDHVMKATLGAISVFIFINISISYYGSQKFDTNVDKEPTVFLDPRFDMAIPDIKVIIPPKPIVQSSVQARSSIFVAPKVVSEDVAEQKENFQTPQENTVIDNKNTNGTGNSTILTNGDEGVGFEEENVKTAIVDKKVHTFVEQMPSFPDGEAALFKFISEHMNYPTVAKENNIVGTVFLSFTINIDGSVQDIEVKRGIGGGCNEEAIRVIASMPLWNPGKQNGSPVRVRYSLPLKFVLH